MRFDIVTLFPAIFDGYLTQGLLDKAIQRNLVEIQRLEIDGVQIGNGEQQDRFQQVLHPEDGSGNFTNVFDSVVGS